MIGPQGKEEWRLVEVKKWGTHDLVIWVHKTKIFKPSTQRPEANLQSTLSMTPDRAEAVEPSDKSMTNEKNVMAKKGRQRKKKKRKVSNAITNKGERPTSEKLCKGGTSMDKQQLVKKAATSNKQSITESKRKKMNEKRKCQLAPISQKA
ncbi:unnamed protein product [Fusarium graminearum]|uniref:Uncharacterized protein n=1 Tax=Gibberella zeae TaxID=5518 RepID=A0A9N8NGG1_GIBZA|nr:unnamed protein product [Fusarium graminearum]